MVGARLGLRVEAPVDAWAVDHLPETGRHMDERMPIAAAGFEQQHTVARVRAQPVGQHAAGRASAHHDVIELVHAAPCLSADTNRATRRHGEAEAGAHRPVVLAHTSVPNRHLAGHSGQGRSSTAGAHCHRCRASTCRRPHAAQFKGGEHVVRRPIRALEGDCVRGGVFGVDPERAGADGFEAKQNLPVAAGCVDASVDCAHQWRSSQVRCELRQGAVTSIHSNSVRLGRL